VGLEICAGCEFSGHAWKVNLVMDGKSRRFLWVNEDEISLPSRVPPVGRPVINSYVQHRAHEQRKVADLRRLKRAVKFRWPGSHSQPHPKVNISESYPDGSLVRQNPLRTRTFPVQPLPLEEHVVAEQKDEHKRLGQRHKAPSSLKPQLVRGSTSRAYPPGLSSQIGGLRVDPFQTYPIESKGCVPGAIDYCTILWLSFLNKSC
jgi:hypothetical protein